MIRHLVWGIILLLTVQAQTPPSASDLAGTNWTLQSYGLEDAQQSVLPEAPIALEFDETGKGVGGSSGCNSYGSTLTLDGNSLTLTPPISTMKACAENIMQQEQNFFEALTAVTSLEQTEGQLILSGGGQRLVFVSTSSESSPPSETATLEGTSWRLQRFTKGSTLVENAPITLEFRTDGQLGGSAGCNTYRGSVTFEGNTLKVSPLATTRKACAEDVMTQETMYLRSLHNAITFERTDDTLTLFAGEEGLEFVLAQTDSSTTPPTANETATNDVIITSSNELDVATLGTSNPFELALALLDIPDAPSVQITRQDTSPTESVITLIADGQEDDSVAAKLTRLTFTKSENGNWNLMSGLEAVKCRRGEDSSTFVEGPCP
jgi:heat shock protein HslJ